jgi:glutathione synthase/RimK-type ligase-like ATP-grasp enzyme
MLVDIAVFLATPYDARKGDVFQQRSMLVQDFVQTIIHDQMRMVAGNQRFITRQELTRKTAGVSLLPPTRMSQLFGG